MKSGSGVYENEPSAFTVTVPLAGAVSRLVIIASPSTSTSLARTPGAGSLKLVSSSSVYESALATGASF